jgi:hypothetical protein
MRQAHLRPVFVEFIPETLEEGILYVSMEFRATAHRCCCGCGSPVYLPLARTKWTLTFDGEFVWMNPSVGSWSLPCRSHYWIRGNRIQWAEQWTAERVEPALLYEQHGCDQHVESQSRASEADIGAPRAPPRSRWTRFKTLLGLN